MPLLAALTGQNMIDRLQTMTDDTLDSDQALFYLNAAKDEVESGRDWLFNRAFDNSQTWSPGDTYLTMKTLPSDFLFMREVYLDQDILPYIEIPFELRQRFKDIYRRYYIDFKNAQFAICGSGPGVRTINLTYGCATNAITLTTSPSWPTQFQALIPFRAASIWSQAQDADNINWRLGKEQERMAASILKNMIAWDARRKTKMYNSGNAQNYDLNAQPNVVATDFLV